MILYAARLIKNNNEFMQDWKPGGWLVLQERDMEGCHGPCGGSIESLLVSQPHEATFWVDERKLVRAIKDDAPVGMKFEIIQYNESPYMTKEVKT